mmetsp:Transcript_29686/g.55216  ORF Transcript_29686/g.55216 Transcript_29686/m.55216 type:complete len:95 (+) Transcript_29686:87-371(+)
MHAWSNNHRSDHALKDIMEKSALVCFTLFRDFSCRIALMETYNLIQNKRQRRGLFKLLVEAVTEGSRPMLMVTNIEFLFHTASPNCSHGLQRKK